MVDDDGTYGSFLVSSGLLSFWGVSKYESASVPFGAWRCNAFFFTGTHSEATEEGRKRDTKEEEEEAATTTTTTNIPTPPVTTDGNQPPQTTQISELKFG
jgi:hypothetical protein